MGSLPGRLSAPSASPSKHARGVTGVAGKPMKRPTDRDRHRDGRVRLKGNDKTSFVSLRSRTFITAPRRAPCQVYESRTLLI